MAGALTRVGRGAALGAVGAGAGADGGRRAEGTMGDRRGGASAGNVSRCFGATTEAADGGYAGKRRPRWRGCWVIPRPWGGRGLFVRH